MQADVRKTDQHDEQLQKNYKEAILAKNEHENYMVMSTFREDIVKWTPKLKLQFWCFNFSCVKRISSPYNKKTLSTMLYLYRNTN